MTQYITLPRKADDPLYGIWAGIIKRCSNPNAANYANYGGRGITVCDEWRNSFESFHTCVSQLPDCGKEGYSLDRIDNDGNYEPGNVRWASQKTQNRNKSVSHMLTYNGKTQCLADWAEEYGIDYSRLKGRIRLGWTMEDALTNPVGIRRSGKNRPVYPYGEQNQSAKLTSTEVVEIRIRHANGETQAHLGAEYNISPSAIGKIVRRETWTHVP